jgi:hypothetical protein
LVARVSNVAAFALSDAGHRAKFAAREYVARIEREAGMPYSHGEADAVAMTYETGYLRGANEAHEELATMHDEIVRVAREAARLEGENGRLAIETNALQQEAAFHRREAELLQSLNESYRRELDLTAQLEVSRQREVELAQELLLMMNERKESNANADSE